MSSLSKNANRSLRMESLEERQLMAGDVSVGMTGGELMIEGDTASNAVQVSKLTDGGYRITGLWADGAQTSINGRYSTTVNNVDNMTINLGRGDDRLYINNTLAGNDLVVEGDLKIRTGGGDDYVRILNTTVEGNVSIVTDQDASTGASRRYAQPSGDDYVSINGLHAYNDVNIKTGEGSDTVKFEASYNTYQDWNFANKFSINTGVGTNTGDTVDLDYVFAFESIELDTGNGHDSVQTQRTFAVKGIDIATRGGHDTVSMHATDMEWNGLDWQASILIDTGSGNDVVVLDDIDVHGGVTVLTGNGNDSVEMNDVHSSSMIYASLGKDTDVLKISNSSAPHAYLFGGKGINDSLEVIDSAIDELYQVDWEFYTNSSRRSRSNFSSPFLWS